MVEPVDVRVFFNFRSPYCYLFSKRVFPVLEDFRINLEWRPLGGWDGRSPPDRAKFKLPIARQDAGRWAKRMGIPFNPPPPTMEPTIAGAGSLLAEEKGLLEEYVIEVMRGGWEDGKDMGDLDLLLAVGTEVGLDRDELAAAVEDPTRLKQLEANWDEAAGLNVIGVPTVVIEDQIYWGNDRLDFVEEHLLDLRLARL